MHTSVVCPAVLQEVVLLAAGGPVEALGGKI